MSHLTPAELVDAAEGVLDASRQEHLDRCDRCRVELNALAEVLRDLPAAPVPEPSPLFWEHFATRVRDAIAAEQRERQRTMSWDGIRWSALVPLGAFAVVILALLSSVPFRDGTPVSDRPVEDGSLELAVRDVEEVDLASADAEWAALADLVGPLDWDTAGEAGLVIGPGTTAAAMADLTPDERRELSRLVSREVGRPKS